MPELFEFYAKVRETDVGLREINGIIKKLKNQEILVGIPQDKTGRKVSQENSQGISNAELLYIHTNGSPVNNIPARPVIEPAIEDSKEEIGLLIKEAAEQALSRNLEGAMAKLDKAGMQGENAAKAWFTNPKNHWAPNSQVTIEGSASDKNGKKFIKGKKSSTPLIDTGQMRKAITHVMHEK